MIGIYKITNLINGKEYVGQSINIERRIKDHFLKALNINDCSYNTAIHQAIRKYGAENFDWKIVEECSVDDIDDKERYYIQYFNTLAPNGYNILPGGQKHRAIPVFCERCGQQITGDGIRNLCRDCWCKSEYNRKVVNRPDKDELIRLLKQYNFIKVGKMFGVSDNAVRKWCKKYGISSKASDYK